MIIYYICYNTYLYIFIHIYTVYICSLQSLATTIEVNGTAANDTVDRPETGLSNKYWSPKCAGLWKVGRTPPCWLACHNLLHSCTDQKVETKLTPNGLSASRKITVYHSSVLSLQRFSGKQITPSQSKIYDLRFPTCFLWLLNVRLRWMLLPHTFWHWHWLRPAWHSGNGSHQHGAEDDETSRRSCEESADFGFEVRIRTYSRINQSRIVSIEFCLLPLHLFRKSLHETLSC